MPEYIGYAVLNRNGRPLTVTTYQRQDAIRTFIDPGFNLSKEERREAWKKWRKKYGVRCVRATVVIEEDDHA